ncbi:MAG: hypothetical protein ACREEM_24830 [Blastocatellia bacterium]
MADTIKSSLSDVNLQVSRSLPRDAGKKLREISPPRIFSSSQRHSYTDEAKSLAPQWKNWIQEDDGQYYKTAITLISPLLSLTMGGH